MTSTPNHASDSPVPELRRAATSLIMGQLGAVVDQDLDWLGVIRKRIKDRMSDAKHIMFNNEMKLRLIESQLEKGTASAAGGPPVKTLIQQHQMLSDKNQELGRIADVCGLALSLLDRQGKTAPTPAPRAAASRKTKASTTLRVRNVAANAEIADVEETA